MLLNLFNRFVGTALYRVSGRRLGTLRDQIGVIRLDYPSGPRTPRPVWILTARPFDWHTDGGVGPSYATQRLGGRFTRL